MCNARFCLLVISIRVFKMSATVFLIPFYRDGLNLVALEYVACHEKRHGVLVLSEFTGAATFMKRGKLND